MYCHNCKKEIPNTTNYCPYCGVQTSTLDEQSDGYVESSKKIHNSIPHHYVRPQQNNNSKTSISLLIPVTVGIITLLGWFWFCIKNINQAFEVGFFPYICVCMFGAAFFGGSMFGISIVIFKFIERGKNVSRGHSQYTYQNPHKNNVPVNAASAKLVAPDYDAMDGHTFEFFCHNLLIKNGFENVTVTKGSGDQGIDIIAFKGGIKYGIQCKCYTSDIGNKAVQEAFSGKTFYNCHVGVVLTNRKFTKSAVELAEKNGIILWDRGVLEKLVENSKI